MVIEGLKLMVIGMAIVYVFLIILMLLVMLSARLFRQRVSTVPASSPVSNSGDQDDDLVAVISAAISRYKSGK